MKRMMNISASLLCVLALAACADMTRTQQRTLSGAAIGAGVGGVGSAVTGGSTIGGAAIGAAAGAGAGYLYDQHQKRRGN